MKTVQKARAGEKPAWLKCSIGKGMFATERLVSINSEHFFVSESDVDEERGLLRVRVARENGHLLALIPTEYGDVVRVSPELVKP